MIEFNWQEDLATGISLVDEQHQELLKRANDFLEHMKTGDEIDHLIKLLDYLTIYVYDHFVAEEKAMSENNYPNYLAHKHEHTQFINIVSDLELRMPKEINLLSFRTEVQDKIYDWLSNHILVLDKEMAIFLQSNHKQQLNHVVNQSPLHKI